MKKKSKRRKRFQVIEAPAPGEARERAPRIRQTFHTAADAVETARWGAFNHFPSGRRYLVRDRTRKEIVFEIDTNKASHDQLCAVLYESWQNLAPQLLTEIYSGEWLHEDYYEQRVPEEAPAA